MKLFHLIKKDFLIVKKYVWIMFLVCVLIPPFMLWRMPQYAGPLGFILSVVFADFILLQYVLLKECQYPKASTLLRAAPYPCRLLVWSKYIFCLLIYAACCVIFWMETLVFSGLGEFEPAMPVCMFLVIALLIGIYLPVQYKLGYEKTKLAFVVIFMAFPFLLPGLLEMGKGINLDFLYALPPSLLYGGVLLTGFLILLASVRISVGLYACGQR